MFMKTNLQVLLAITSSVGVVLVISGVFYKTYSNIAGLMIAKASHKERLCFRGKAGKVMYTVTGIPLIKNLRDKVEEAIYANSETKEEAMYKAAGVSVLFIFLCVFNLWTLKDIGELWYTKILVIAISIFLPYYVLTLIIDLLKNRVNSQVPEIIDEFRGAFLKYGRIKPALLESAKHTGGRLGAIVERAVLSTDVTESLQGLKSNLNNVWFGIFVQLLINFKTNGGELIDQLYKLNKTMVLYNNLEKKKSKRLIWYEIFAITVAFVSIPVIYWFNFQILGSKSFVASDAQANLSVSRIIGLSIFSLIVIRILRKL